MAAGTLTIPADWQGVQNAKASYREMFGRYYIEVDNNEVLNPSDAVQKLAPELFRAVIKLSGGEVRNPIGRQWIKDVNAAPSRAAKIGGGGGVDPKYQRIDPRKL